MTDLQKLFAVLSLLIGHSVVDAQDIASLTKIGAVVSFEKSDSAVNLQLFG
jgi:hypothetical protein